MIKKKFELKGFELETLITLINPSHEVFVAHPSPPLWLAYLQAILKEKGVSVRVIDEAAGQKIENVNTKWVAFSVTTPTTKKVYALADGFRAKGIKVILGGPHATIFPEEAIQHADKVITGEAEEAILIALDSKNFEKIINVSLARELDSLPFPDWSGLPVEKYSSWTRKNHYLAVLTSRGCPYGCVFCFKGIFGKKFRARSSESIVKEIEYLQKNYGAKEISIIDDIFNWEKQRVIDFCNLVLKKGIKIAWTCPNGVRADRLDLEMLKLMKKAGCYQLAFGIESGNQEVLKKINKSLDLGAVRNSVKWCKQVGIQTIGFFMMGLPYDTEETMQQTIDFAKELDCTYSQFTVATPYPGTELFKMIKENGRFLTEDWSQFGSYSGKAYYEYDNLKPELVEKMYKKAIYELYYSPKQLLKKIFKNPKLILAAIKFALRKVKA